MDILTAAGTGIANNIMDIAFNPIKQKQQLKGQKKALEQQNEAQYDMWKKTNYSAQKEELQKAGLNPALLYGMSGGGGATTGSASAMPEQNKAHGMDIAGAAQLSLLQAQKENIEADTANKIADTQKKGVETDVQRVTIDNVRASTGLALQQAKTEETKQSLNRISYSLQKLEYDFMEATYDDRVAQIDKTVEVLGQQFRGLKNQNDITEATKETQIKQAAAYLANTYADTALTQAKTGEVGQNIAESKARIKNMGEQMLVNQWTAQIQGWNSETMKRAQDLAEKIQDMPESEKAALQRLMQMDPLMKAIQGYGGYEGNMPRTKPFKANKK